VARLSRRTWLLLGLIVALGGAARFYGIGWGLPFHHFHTDEHVVFQWGLSLKNNFVGASREAKFFIYGPLCQYLVALLTWGRETLFGPFDLSRPADEIEFMLMGRSIAAFMGTATIPLVFLVARRLSNDVAALLAAAFTAVGVIHLRDSHFLSTDTTLVFFSVLAWWCAIRMAETGLTRFYVLTGIAIGAAVLTKYTGAFLIGVAAIAHVCAPGRPMRSDSWRTWGRWVAKGAVPGVTSFLFFLALFPHIFWDFDRFWADVDALILSVAMGRSEAKYPPMWVAHFVGVSPLPFWFSNVLWWGLGPLFEVWGLLGVVWLAWRRDKAAVMALAFPVAFFAAASQVATPFARYGIPLVPGLGVVAAMFSADLMRRRFWRWPATIATTVVLAGTTLYAAAYMNVYVQPDSRLAASEYLLRNVPINSKILVEPTHNTPPMGSYLAAPNFYVDYVLWGPYEERHSYYHLYSLDTYRYLYDTRASPRDKRSYIDERLALVDYIVIDDTYIQWYEGLPAADFAVVKQYYMDLLAGRLGFHLMASFKSYPSLFGMEINDDAAELTFRLVDHPRIFVFARKAS
jgi:4-amino-4-deoxy-L-arabinose transferase-like glycosyltransferase